MFLNFFSFKKIKNSSIGKKSHRLDENDLTYVDSSGSYSIIREVCRRFRVDVGHYIIIPSTWYKDQESHFLLRICSEK
jgi:hypothetical protein